MGKPLIRGKSYGWSSIETTILGVQVIGITNISYSDEQEIKPNFGAGNQVVSVGFGNIENKASITLHAEEVEKLQEVAPNGRLQEIPPFDIVVSYLSGTLVKTHKLISCIFTNNSREAKQGDTLLEVKLELFVGEINWKA